MVILHEVVGSHNKMYLVMELLKGSELLDHIFEFSRFSEQQACEVLVQLVRTLQHLHANGICHRDIKPENVMFSEKVTLKSVDVHLNPHCITAYVPLPMFQLPVI